MPTRLVHVVMDAADPVSLARSWSAALGWPIVSEESEEVVVEPPEDDSAQQGQLPLIFVRAPEVKTTRNRVHLDLASVSAEQQAALVARLEELGARATGWAALGQDDQGVWIRDVTAGGPYLDLHRVSEPKQVKLRVHLGVAPFAHDDHAAEGERLRAIGARGADAGQTNVRWVVLSDPEGNELSVLIPR